MDEREAMEGSGLVEVENRLRPQEFAPRVRNAFELLAFFSVCRPLPCWVEAALYIDRAWADESHGGLGLKDSLLSNSAQSRYKNTECCFILSKQYHQPASTCYLLL